ncbi:MAG: hypothetical protein IT172_04455 [Acidobacteria bacterium]|nr:hypothetical protein [Acidobacteriota bacterium]
MMKRTLLLVLPILLLTVLSCRLAEKVTSLGGDLNRVGDMWSDVPKMDGFANSEADMPFAFKLILRTALNNLWRVNDEREDRTPATGDWLVYSTTAKPADVAAFYTNAKMTAYGKWDASDKPSCIDGRKDGIPGELCVFKKTEGDKETGLAVVAVADEKGDATNVFFLRIETPRAASNTTR